MQLIMQETKLLLLDLIKGSRQRTESRRRRKVRRERGEASAKAPSPDEILWRKEEEGGAQVLALSPIRAENGGRRKKECRVEAASELP